MMDMEDDSEALVTIQEWPRAYDGHVVETSTEHEGKDEYTAYHIEVRRCSGDREPFRVKKRYRQFRDLHQKLDKVFNVPQLPPKAFNKLKAKVVQERRTQLDEYLDKVLDLPCVSLSPDVRAFFNDGERDDSIWKESKVYGLQKSQIQTGREFLANIFVDSKVWSYVTPDNTERRKHLSKWFKQLQKKSVHHGYALSIDDPIKGIALWLPPEVDLDFGYMFKKRQAFANKRWETIMYKIEENRKELMQGTPHWYLLCIAVEEGSRHRNLGKILLRPVLLQSDKLDVPCFLWADNEASAHFFVRHGFSIVRKQEYVGSDFPTIYYLTRSPGAGRLSIFHEGEKSDKAADSEARLVTG